MQTYYSIFSGNINCTKAKHEHGPFNMKFLILVGSNLGLDGSGAIVRLFRIF